MTRRLAMNRLPSSRLYDQNTFYPAFEKDLRKARISVPIESPFIAAKRFENLLPVLCKLRARGTKIIVNTGSHEESEGDYRYQTTEAVNEVLRLGIAVLFTGKHHCKLGIIDKEIL